MSDSPVLLRNLIYDRSWYKVDHVCRSSPAQSKVADRLGDLPLHEVCIQAAPLKVIKTLVKAHPDGVRTRGFCGRLPLHYASYIKPSIRVIKYLMKKFPGGASIKDSDGRLPVHLAVIRNAPNDVIETLILAYPECHITHNNFGSTPQMLAQTASVSSMFRNAGLRPIKSIQKMRDMEDGYQSDHDGTHIE